MRKLILLAMVTCMLVSCGGSSQNSGVDCVFEYWDGQYGTCLPEGWSVLDQETLYLRGITDETAVVFHFNEPVAGQFPNIALTKRPLAAQTMPGLYSQESIKSVAAYGGYTLLDLKEITIDGEELQLHIFKAKPDGVKEYRYYQVSTVAGDFGYTLTAMVPVTIDSNLEEHILKIFGCSSWQQSEEIRQGILSEC